MHESLGQKEQENGNLLEYLQVKLKMSISIFQLFVKLKFSYYSLPRTWIKDKATKLTVGIGPTKVESFSSRKKGFSFQTLLLQYINYFNSRKLMQ